MSQYLRFYLLNVSELRIFSRYFDPLRIAYFAEDEGLCANFHPL